MQPRERRPVDAVKKKALYTVAFFIIHIHKVGSDIFRYTCVSFFSSLVSAVASVRFG